MCKVLEVKLAKRTAQGIDMEVTYGDLCLKDGKLVVDNKKMDSKRIHLEEDDLDVYDTWVNG